MTGHVLSSSFLLLSLMTAFDSMSDCNSSTEVKLNGSDVFPILHRAILWELYFINPQGPRFFSSPKLCPALRIQQN